MKNAIVYTAAFLLFASVIEAQNNKVKLSFDYGRSHSFLKLEDGNEGSTNSTFQLGLDYRLSEHWHLNIGLRHMITDYKTEFTQRIVHQSPIGGVSTSISSLSYRNLSLPISIGYEPLRHLVVQLSVIPTRNETAYDSASENEGAEMNFMIENAAGSPRQFGVFLGSSIEYGIDISKRIELRLGARATTSVNTLLKGEATLTRLTDFGAFVGIGVKL